jgi:hypothetical protein
MKKEIGRKKKKKKEEAIEFGWCNERIYFWRVDRKINRDDGSGTGLRNVGFFELNIERSDSSRRI